MKKHKQKRMFIVTNRDAVVSEKFFNQFALKASATDGKSQAILTDPFTATYGKNLLAPRVNPESLAQLSSLNTYHKKAVKVKSIDVAGSGWGLTPVSGIEKPSEKNKLLLKEFFSSKRFKLPVGQLLTRVMTDFEGVGYGVFEMTRSRELMPHSLVHLAAHT